MNGHIKSEEWFGVIEWFDSIYEMDYKLRVVVINYSICEADGAAQWCMG